MGAQLVGREPLPERRERLLPGRAPEPAQPDARSQASRGAGDHAEARRARRRARPELPPGRHDAPRPRLGAGPGDQPAAHLRLRLRLRGDESVPRSPRAGPAHAGRLGAGLDLGPGGPAAHARWDGRDRPARRLPAGAWGARRAPRARAHRAGPARRGEHAAGGARPPARDRDVRAERGAAREERDAARQHLPPAAVRHLRDERRVPGALDVAAGGAPRRARPARPRALHDGPVAVRGARGGGAPDRAGHQEAQHRRVARSPRAPRHLGGAGPDARRDVRRPRRAGGGAGRGDRPPPGEHTEEILRQYGYADDAIRRLRDASVV
ncbi:MAG: hypothetical protein HW381_1060 [Candidatus Rokubacteria bacterium]|nr:hypothetical protein [Candidatus Rokubacteria bacterium]